MDLWSNVIKTATPLSRDVLQNVLDELSRPGRLRIEPEVEIISPDEYAHRKEHGCRGGWCYYESTQKPQKGVQVTQNG